MRLDHLLSKERLAIREDRPEPFGGYVATTELMGGTLTSSRLTSSVCEYGLTQAWKIRSEGRNRVGTLLGPEGAETNPQAYSHDECAQSDTSTHRTIRTVVLSTPAGHAVTRRCVARTLRTAQWTRASLWPS